MCVICELCSRIIPKKLNSEHHLIPKSKGGGKGEKVNLHRICHGKIHSVFTDWQLANEYNNMDAIKKDQSIRSFIFWIRNKPDDFDDSNKLINKLRRKR